MRSSVELGCGEPEGDHMTRANPMASCGETREAPATSEGLPQPNTHARFEPTQWSAVLQAQGKQDVLASQALERLCRICWPPICAFIRRRGSSPADAKDLTQSFFADLLQRDWLSGVGSREGGLFRSFLMACVTNFLNNHQDKQASVKRGGGLEQALTTHL